MLARVSSLKIRALNLVEGLLSGQHRSRHKGASVEFAEYKDYSPGDEIRHIDWKVVGKTDKYHVKQFEQSTNLKCTILLDESGSMGYESPHPRGPSKIEYARTLVASLACLLLKQSDAVGLSLFNDQVARYIPPRSKASHFQHILHGLAEMEPRGVTRIDRVIDSLLERLPSRSLLVLISDLLAKEDDIQKDLKLLASRDLEVILFHILDPDEVNLPFEGDTVFESLEDDPTVGLDPEDIRDQYQKLIRDQIEHYRRMCPGLGIDYVFLETTTPLDQALSYYLLKRSSMSK
ncbi:MAG: DUF58 domain-containing protein, partial [Nitrospinaceae bacterium]|nr:DUF58 domain-containing protein [Nitrospinaceae bacterium]NIR55847.1 DUF58 domain-containing protein [Nitrospinaceae bacterium]NIS86300.1 DUF58 domain-containing protein [Nitrospinaceae bacterium]NIT83129.1 DUF58 domain-containing protein [Nitrospinaceae bacterium]NIU45339.1 DUF58 domain-containing protein [Nitrospinaceae bacterium]